jgi:acyl-CoA reductase-like NAD-dependent aldehyde dehydrogenase
MASFSIKSPVDGQTEISGSYLSLDEARRRVAQAQSAALAFRNVKVSDRVALCLRFLDELDRESERYAAEVTLAMGKPLAQARGEIKGARARTEALCRGAEVTLADVRLPPVEGITRFIRHEPLGVVLDIAAWNYPYVVAINVVIPALLAGNAVLLKHAPQTACVGRQFEEAFSRAGAPGGLVQDFMLDHPTVASVLSEAHIASVGFTGSVRGGHEVYQAVARAGFARCGLEMGGKDAALVLEDADIGFAAVQIADGAFYNAGQSCCAVERVYVPRRLAKEFIEALTAEAKNLKLGDPRDADTTLGPVVSAEAARRITAQIDEALAQGARDELPGSGEGDFPSACYLAPRVITGATHQMSLMTEETFGPALGVQVYDDLEEGIRLVNDSRYGLTASVWTKDEEKAVQVGDRLEVGTVYMNRCDAVDADLPWVGAKESGLGFTLSQEGILAMTRPKSFHLKL